jgi:DNA segregation ATPase FtsK/SpoIIIE, S-DNA-T family
LRELAHCGTTVTADDFSLVVRLLQRLRAEVGDRRMRGDRTARANLLLLIDGWERFSAAADHHDINAGPELLTSLARDAASAGMTIVVAGDRGLLTARLAAHATHRYLLRLADRADYALAGLAPSAVPTHMPPGRAIRAEDAVEVQFVHLDERSDVDQRGDGVSATATAAATAAPRRRPISVKPLPTLVSADTLPAVGAPTLLLGVGGDDAEPIGFDPFCADQRFIIVGPARSGRSTALLLLLEQAVARSWAVHVAAPPGSPVATAARRLGLHHVGPQPPHGDMECLRGEQNHRTLIIVDDGTAFDDTRAGDQLAELLRAPTPDVAVVASADVSALSVGYRGVAASLRSIRNGLWLQPRPADGEAFGMRVSRAFDGSAGRGILVVTPEMIVYSYSRDGPPPVEQAGISVQVALPMLACSSELRTSRLPRSPQS